MSDFVGLALDEYIKKKKIPRGGRAAKVSVGKRGQLSGLRGKKGGAKRGRLSGRGNSAGGRGRGVTNAVRGGFGRRGGRGGVQTTRGRGRFQRKRTNFPAGTKLQVQPNSTPRNSRISTRGRFQNRRQNLKTRFAGVGLRTPQTTRPRNRNPRYGGATANFLSREIPAMQSFARQRVQRARNVLARRGVNPVQGRISVSRSGRGLITTTRQNNLRRQRELMQEKIIRAQQARSNPGSALRSLPGQPRWSVRKPQNRNRDRPVRPLMALMGDEWVSTSRTVRNTDIELVPRRSSSGGSGLNPEIQRRIQILQQQGRRTRGEDLVDSSISSDFRGPVVTSRMALSDRFRTFMN